MNFKTFDLLIFCYFEDSVNALRNIVASEEKLAEGYGAIYVLKTVPYIRACSTRLLPGVATIICKFLVGNVAERPDSRSIVPLSHTVALSP